MNEWFLLRYNEQKTVTKQRRVFMKKFGLCSVTFRQLSPIAIIQLAKESGLNGIEWGGDVHVPIHQLDRAREIGRQTQRAGLEVSSYGSYYYAGQQLDFEPYLQTALALGTKDIRIWSQKMDREKQIGLVNEEKLSLIVADIKRAALLAHPHDISLHIEFHQGTYTDSTESAIRLIEEINEPNVFLYWQPLAYLSADEHLEQIERLGNRISHVHVFHWDENNNRHPLKDGHHRWINFVEKIETKSRRSRYYLMEFVKDNTIEQLMEDVDTLKQL